MTLRILIAADGSPYTKLAAKHVAEHLDWFSAKPDVHVLHVEPPMPYPRAQALVGKAAVLAYQREEAEAALALAEAELDKAGVPYRTAWRVGDVVAEIAAYVKANRIDLLVMGSHGKGALASLALGSIAQKCLATLEVPILVLRRPAQKPAAKSTTAATRVPARATP
jgi:nucleotide-binding universal stress UspA family protein